jgi:hypothetical protein
VDFWQNGEVGSDRMIQLCSSLLHNSQVGL